jgi:hypothetical protein
MYHYKSEIINCKLAKSNRIDLRGNNYSLDICGYLPVYVRQGHIVRATAILYRTIRCADCRSTITRSSG